MKILVTGGAGFIGSHLCDYLREKGHEVSVIDPVVDGLKCQDTYVPFGTEFIYHLASTVGVENVVRDPAECVRNSIFSLDRMLKWGIPGIFTSSSEVYGMYDGVMREDGPRVFDGSPRWAYAYAKLCCEYLALDAGWKVVRFFNVTGPRQRPEQGVVARWEQQIAKGEPVEIYGDGRDTRQFISVHQVVRILDTLRDKEFDVVNIGGGTPISMNELAVKLGAHHVVHKPIPAGHARVRDRRPSLTKLHSLLEEKVLTPA